MTLTKEETTEMKNLDDKLSECLKKSRGIAALINVLAATDDSVLDSELEWASWALMDFLSEAHAAADRLSDLRSRELITNFALNKRAV